MFVDPRLQNSYSLPTLCADLNIGKRIAPAVPFEEVAVVRAGVGFVLGYEVQGGIMSRFRNLFLSLCAVAVIACMSANAQADTITVVGADSGQFSTATVVCEFNAQTNTFTFTITNTSAITQPGSTSTITSIGFDLPPVGNASSSGLNGFTGLQAPSLSSTFTFSDGDLGNISHGFNNAVLDFGFITGSNFGGGSPNLGLLPGESASFTVSGAAFAGFTEAEICNAILVRFQNVPLEGGSEGSDVGSPGNPIPEPSSMLLLGSALIGLGGYVRRRMKR